MAGAAVVEGAPGVPVGVERGGNVPSARVVAGWASGSDGEGESRGHLGSRKCVKAWWERIIGLDTEL